MLSDTTGFRATSEAAGARQERRTRSNRFGADETHLHAKAAECVRMRSISEHVAGASANLAIPHVKWVHVFSRKSSWPRAEAGRRARTSLAKEIAKKRKR